MTVWDTIFAALSIQPLLFVVLIIHGYRLRIYLDSSVSIWRACESISLSLTLGLIMPARMGEIIKPLYLNYKEKIIFSHGMGAILVERIFDLLFFICVTFLVMISIGVKGKQTYLILLSCILLILIVVILSYIKHGNKFAIIMRNLGMVKLSDFMLNNLNGMKIALNYAFSIKVLFLGLMAWILTFSLYILFFKIISSNEISLFGASSSFVAGTLGMGIGLTPGSFGTFESALGAVLFHEGLSLNDILLMVIVFRIATSLPATLIAIVVIIRDASLISKIRKSAREKSNANK